MFAWPRFSGSARLVSQAILVQVGLDMTRFPTVGRLVSWAKPATRRDRG